MNKFLANEQLIEDFLDGNNNPKFERITYINTSSYNNNVYLKKSLSNGRKEYLSNTTYDIPALEPYLYLKKSVYDKLLNKFSNFSKILADKDITVKHLTTHFKDEKPSKRMLDGYNVMLSTKKLSLYDLRKFMGEIGIAPNQQDKNGEDILYDLDGNKIQYNSDNSITLITPDGFPKKTIKAEKVDKIEKRTKRTTDYIILSSDEQYLIQNNIKMFKGIESVKDTHTMVVDIETDRLGENGSALKHDKGFIFQIGLRDNRGFNKILTCTEGGSEKEGEIIEEFFDTLLDINPDNLIYHYGEFFDLWFILGRAKHFDIDEEYIQAKIVKYYQQNYGLKLYGGMTFNRRSRSLKVGGQTEQKTQTNFFGINFIDTIDAVKRAAELDRTIPNNKLKDNVVHIGKEKPNRVYIVGSEIGNLFRDKRDYAYNTSTGDYQLLEGELKDGYKIAKGCEIEEQYLIDDLDETLELFYHYNEAPFLLNAWLPLSYQSTCVAGGASTWMKLYYAWSYTYNIAIPLGDKKRKYLGGLVGMLKSGWMGKGGKLDFASLYPSLYLEYVVGLLNHLNSIHDITDFFPNFLKYSCDNRNKFKKLASKFKKEGNKEMAGKYAAIQLPFKINNNSFYGSLAFFMNNLSHIDSAELITCLGRFWDRHIYHYFTEVGLEIMYCHTDSVHFIFTDNFNYDYKYIGLGKNSLVKKDKEYVGLEAYVAEYNDGYMVGYMGLDIDEIFDSCINFSKSNYMTIEKGKIKTVGNTAKTKAKANYIGELMNESKPLILNRKGEEFSKLYMNVAKRIIEGEMTWKELMQFNKINMEQSYYEETYINDTDINDNLNKRMVHHEIVKKLGLRVGIGDRIHYINTGKSKNDLNFSLSPIKLGYIKFEDEKVEKMFVDDITDLFKKKKLVIEDIISRGDIVLSTNRSLKSNLIDDIVNVEIEDVDDYINHILEHIQIDVKGKNKLKILQNVFLKNQDDYKENIRKKLVLKDGVYYDLFKNSLHDISEWQNILFKKLKDRLEIYYKVEQLNCELVTEDLYDKVGDYNVAKYIDKLNSAIEPFTVVFKPETRSKFLVYNQEDITKRINTKLDYSFVSGVPYKPYIQQTPLVLTTPTKEERDFFRKVGVSPNYPIDKITFNSNEDIEYKGNIYKGHQLVDVILNKPLNIEMYGFEYYNYGYKLEVDNLVIHWGYHNKVQIFNKKTKHHEKHVPLPQRTNKKDDVRLMNDMDRMLTLIQDRLPEYYQKCLSIREQDILQTYGSY